MINIVFAWEQALAITTESERGFIASHRFPMFSALKGKSHLPFMLHFFMRKRGKSLLALASPGGAGRNKTLGQNEFAKLEVVLPDPIEQNKIASFLGVVEAKLEALSRKEEMLGLYRAGIMQKLFTQQLRFARDDGTAFPDWEEKRLNEVFDWVKTNNLSREFLTLDGGTVQNIHYGDIHTKFRPLFRQSMEQAPFIGPNSDLKSFSDEEYCRVGDVVIADASEDYADVGKAIEVVEVRDRSLVAGLHTFIARPKTGMLAVGFTGYLLRSASMRRQIMRIAQGISVLGLSRGNFGKLSFRLPHPDEQRKIANFLSAINSKIHAVTDQTSGLRAFKNSLLQQMFV